MKNISSKKLILIIFSCLGLFLIISCLILFGITFLFNGTEIEVNLDDTATVEEYNAYKNYLGYETREINIKNYDELNTQIFLFYYNWETLVDYENEMYIGASSSDVDTFFTYYAEYNKVLGEMYSQATSINTFFKDPQNDGGVPVGNLLRTVSAKERWSFLYWIPIVEKLVKGKHTTIETSRASIYNYIKNDPGLESVDRQAFLDEYGLKSVEDIRSLSDSKVEQMARDPELRTSIDWGKLSAEVGKSGVEAYVDVIKSATSGDLPNPIKDTIKNGLVDIADGKIDTVGDQMPSVTSNKSDKDKVTLGSKTVVAEIVSDTLGNDIDTDWENVSDDKKDLVLERLLAEIENGPLFVAHSPDSGEENKFQMPVGNWDLLGMTDGSVPVEIADVEIKEGKTTQIEKPVLDTAFVVDVDVLSNLGALVNVNITVPTVTDATSCQDYGVLDNTGGASKCESNFNSCSNYPLVIKEGYSQCVGSNGGCWDIGRSASFESPDSCPKDLSTMNKDDFQYNGNLRYCQCVQTCKAEFTSTRNCGEELNNCCSNLL